MTPILCRYKCGTMLDGFDEEAHKYKEAQTGGIHTKERCQEAKAKVEAKNDHGNEQSMGQKMLEKEIDRRLEQGKKVFVDHTQGQKLKLRIFSNPTPGGLELEYNNFAAVANIKFSQYQIAGSLYTIAVWYSEEGKQ